MKALYVVYGIVLLGALGVAYNMYSSLQKVEQNAISCLKLEMPEQDKCFEKVGRQAANLDKAVKAITGQN
ncbi:hypothetical protein [Pseudomonas edaphica]|uniref:hypothetical protein n=1 Tax=Pseudomonas edaphica TaxID=2006980 RepID=UPI003D0FFB85